MITFVSLFLGLTLGLKPVEMTVGDGTARVEVRKNDESIGTLTAPPWTLDCDFGLLLEPQKLEAVAFDAEDRELGRAVQWINLPKAPAVANLTFEGPASDRLARLAWESIAGAEPVAVRVDFDGRRLPVEDPREFPLPAHDERQLHFLRVELDFGENVTTVAETTFGGTYGEQVSTEMTALPIVVEGKKAPVLEDLRGLFFEDGRPLVVRAVEKGLADLVVVVDESFREDLTQIRRRIRFQRRSPQLLRMAAQLKRDQRLRFVHPIPEPRQGVGQDYNIFPISPEFDTRQAGLFALLAQKEPVGTENQQVGSAMAVAGLVAAERHRRRAVVVILGSEIADASNVDVAMARHYLDTLRVPLYVWSSAPAATAETPWGEAEDVSYLGRLETAVAKVRKDLERQWMVWLDGVHLPQKIELARPAQGLRLVP